MRRVRRSSISLRRSVRPERSFTRKRVARDLHRDRAEPFAHAEVADVASPWRGRGRASRGRCARRSAGPRWRGTPGARAAGSSESGTFTRRTMAMRPRKRSLRSRMRPPSPGRKARISLRVGQPSKPHVASQASNGNDAERTASASAVRERQWRRIQPRAGSSGALQALAQRGEPGSRVAEKVVARGLSRSNYWYG